MEHPEHLPETELSADEFARRVARDPVAALRQFRELQNQARFNDNATPVSSVSSAPSLPPAGLDPVSIAAIA